MKNNNKTTLILFLTAFVIISALCISTYAGLFAGDKKITNIPNVKPPTHKTGDGPIHFTTNLDNTYFLDNRNVYLYVDLKADRTEAVKERTPLNIAIVIDRSGSMADKNKLEYVKKAVNYIIDQLGPEDYVSVVTYDDYVDVVLPSQPLRNKYDLKDKISLIKPGGWTNLSDGMFEGYRQVEKSYTRGYVNRVMLLTDGLANRGITDRFDLADRVRQKNRLDGITISTFGVGSDFNENLLADLSDYGKGNYYYIRNSSDIPEIFASELRDIHTLVGQATKLRVHFPYEYLSVSKVFGYPYDVQGNDIVIDFKDVFSEQTKSVLIKFDIRKTIDKRLDFESELTYENVNYNFDRVTQRDVQSIQPTRSREEFNKGTNETVQQNVSVFESNDMMETALREADNGNYGKAKVLLKDAQDYMSNQMGQVQPSPEMRRQSESMENYDRDLRSADTKTEDEKKEMQKQNKYDNYNLRKKKQ